MSTTKAPTQYLAKLGIDFIEIRLVHQHFTRFAASAWRDQAIHLHHVHETRGPAEADPEPPLQIRNRRLPTRDDDTRGFVVEIVLFHLDAIEAFLLGGDGRVVDGLALFAQEAREPRALLFRDVRAVQAYRSRRSRRHEQHVATAEQLFGAITVENRPRVSF